MGTLYFDSKVPGRSYKALKLVAGALGANGTHQTEPVTIVDYALLRGFVLCDQNSAANGFKLQEGVLDNSGNFKVLKTTSATVTANTPSSVDVALIGEQLRVDYQNGATPATDFNIWLLLVPRDLAGI